MFPLFESILIKEGECQNLPYHRKRIQASRQELFNIDTPLSLTLLQKTAEKYKSGTHKLRFSYGQFIDQVVVEPYFPKSIQSLKIVEASHLDYHLKFTDRTKIDALMTKREDADDIIISINNYLTDASYANIALFDGKEWWTPEQALLNGTRRARLLDQGKIITKPIHKEALSSYKKLSLINAMLDLDELIIPVQNIFL